MEREGKDWEKETKQDEFIKHFDCLCNRSGLQRLRENKFDIKFSTLRLKKQLGKLEGNKENIVFDMKRYTKVFSLIQSKLKLK